MRNITRLLFLILFVSSLAPTVWAGEHNYNKPRIPSLDTAFAKVIDDLPLMPGLEVVQDNDVLFITHAGRIAQTIATGNMDVDEVYQFYQKALPQLGWKAVDARTFERDKERLRLDVSGVTPNAITTVRFSVQPIKN